MSNEIRAGNAPGLALYACLVSPTGLMYNTATPGFEAFAAANWPAYAIPLAEQGTSGIYLGTVPAGVPAGLLLAPVYLRAGAAPALAADVQLDAAQCIPWAGSALAPVQTGDAFARLGAPAGASIAADVATRSTYAGADTPGTATLLQRLPGVVQPQSGDAFAAVAAGPGSALVTGTIAAGSTGSAVLVSGLTAGLNFVGQRLALTGSPTTQRGEIRIIGGQSAAAGLYTFTTIPFSAAAVVAGETVKIG